MATITVGCGHCFGLGWCLGWIFPYTCRKCNGTGVQTQFEFNPQSATENEKESKGMFDTFKEVVDRIDGRAGGWETVTTTLVTPDGKRWKMSKIRVVFTDDNEEDELECELVEVPNRT